MGEGKQARIFTPCGCISLIAVAVVLFLILTPVLSSYNNSRYYDSADYKLFTAAESGDLELAEALIDGGADVNRIPQGVYMARAPLVEAVINQDKPMIDLLLDAGAEVCHENSRHCALVSAVRIEDKELFTYLFGYLDEGSLAGDRSNSLLRILITAGWPEAVRQILARGADPDFVFRYEVDYDNVRMFPPGYSKESALTLSIRNQCLELVETLIKGGADVNRIVDGYSPLLLAMKLNAGNEIVMALLNAGADVKSVEPCDPVKDGMIRTGNASDRDGRRGRSALHFAARCADERVYAALIEGGADIESQDWKQATPLFNAAGSKSDAGVRLLLAAGADPNFPTLAGQVPLHYAAMKGSLENTVLLVEAGADVNSNISPVEPSCNCCKNDTPLHEACGACDGLKVVEYLLEQGADPSIANKDGLTPLQYLLGKPIEEEHSWPRYKPEHGTCTLEDLNANRDAVIELLRSCE